jgi:xylulose-5-phosphate/fructose-6-phosphate phosphoketolase
MTAAAAHFAAGASTRHWAGNERGAADSEPHVVIACAGDVPTVEALAAVTVLREQAPDLRVRVVNVVDLMVLQPPGEHPHGLSDDAFDALFTRDRPVVFAFHGYPSLIHRLSYRRHNHANLHVRGYREEGTTTTPFDMVVLNDLDRYRLALDAIQRVPRLAGQVAAATEWHRTTIAHHKAYIAEHGDDLPEIRDWRWSPAATA